MKDLFSSRDGIVMLAEMYEQASPDEILSEAIKQVPNVAFACSFGVEDMVVLDVLMEVDPNVKVFYLDTDVLFQQTYELIDAAVKKYTITNLIQVRSTLSLAEQAEKYGNELWTSNPDQCCNIRKVQPLRGILSTVNGWITGIRREQSPTRTYAQVFEADVKFGLIKVNPLVRWTEKDVWDYIHEHNVPYNSLHNQGYPSIGCLHCTKPVKPGEDPRSGRWVNFAKTECGLHK